MVNIQEKIEQAFSKLQRERGDQEKYPVISLGKPPHEKEVLLSKDEFGQFNLVIELPEDQPYVSIPVSKALPTQWEKLEGKHGLKTFLRVICIDARLIRTFQSLITEMMVNIYNSPVKNPVILEFVSVAAFWRAILFDQLRGYTLNEAKGLYGELYVLKKFAQIAPQKALKSWRGQENYRHDFLSSNALEVKTYSSFNEPKVIVHGAYQLDPPQSHDLHLFALHVEENESGNTLIETVEQIARLGVPFDLILARMEMSYSALADIQYRFVTNEQKLFKVDCRFPGIRASCVGQDALQGVSNITYSLNLDFCEDSLEIDTLTTVLEDL